MAGQYGNEQVTIQNLTVVKVDAAKNCLFVKGGIPGPEGVLVSVKAAVKGGAK
jgi:large subunit ribosomal protein L3